MATWLKQSTAVDIALGPFVDSTDGFTAETGLTISQADVRLKKNNGNWGQKSESTTATHEENGWYEVPLDTTDTGTLGILVVAVNESGALPVWREFLVVPANVYDSVISGTDKLDVNVEEWNATSVPSEHTAGYPIVTVKDGTGTGEINTTSGRVDADVTHIATAAVSTTTAQLGVNLVNIAGSAVNTGSAQLGVNVVQISGDATAADNAESFFDGTGYAGTNNVIPSVTTVTGNVEGNLLGQVAEIATGGIPAAAFGVDVAAEAASWIWDRASASHVSAGSFGELIQDIDTEVDYIHSVVDSIAVTGSSLTKEASAFTKTVGGTEVNDYTSTALSNGTTHDIPDVTGQIDVYYQFDIGASGTPSKVDLIGRLQVTNPVSGNSINLYAYNWGGTAWDLIHADVFAPTTGTTNTNHTENLLSRHVGTSANDGLVRIRFYNTGLKSGASTLKIDQVLVEYAETLSGDVSAIKTKTDYLPSATAGAAGGVFIAGANAATSITNASGSALTLTSSGGDGHGLLAQGNGSGSGITGSGGNTSGNGIYAAGDGTGMGIYATGGDGSTSAGLKLVSNAASTKYGLLIEDGATITSTFGTGLTISTSGTDQHGMVVTGNGSGGDIVADLTGNVSGSVGSVTGAVGSVTGLTASDVGAIKTKTDYLPSATAGAAGGVFIAGSNAATSITTALTANITGNLSGSVGSVTGAVGSVSGSIGSLGTTAKSDVNAEVVDALATDTYAESAGVPAATSTLAAKITWLGTLARNKITQTATTQTLRNDADGGDIATSTVSDNGTTFSKGKWS